MVRISKSSVPCGMAILVVPVPLGCLTINGVWKCFFRLSIGRPRRSAHECFLILIASCLRPYNPLMLVSSSSASAVRVLLAIGLLAASQAAHAQWIHVAL